MLVCQRGVAVSVLVSASVFFFFGEGAGGRLRFVCRSLDTLTHPHPLTLSLTLAHTHRELGVGSYRRFIDSGTVKKITGNLKLPVASQLLARSHGDARRLTETHGDSRRLTKTHEDSRRLTETHEDSRRRTETDGDSRRLTETHGDSRRLTETHGDSRRLTETHRDSRRLTKTHGDSRRLTETHGDSRRLTKTHEDSLSNSRRFTKPHEDSRGLTRTHSRRFTETHEDSHRDSLTGTNSLTHSLTHGDSQRLTRIFFSFFSFYFLLLLFFSWLLFRMSSDTSVSYTHDFVPRAQSFLANGGANALTLALGIVNSTGEFTLVSCAAVEAVAGIRDLRRYLPDGIRVAGVVVAAATRFDPALQKELCADAAAPSSYLSVVIDPAAPPTAKPVVNILCADNEATAVGFVHHLGVSSRRFFDSECYVVTCMHTVWGAVVDGAWSVVDALGGRSVCFRLRDGRVIQSSSESAREPEPLAYGLGSFALMLPSPMQFSATAASGSGGSSGGGGGNKKKGGKKGGKKKGGGSSAASTKLTVSVHNNVRPTDEDGSVDCTIYPLQEVVSAAARVDGDHSLAITPTTTDNIDDLFSIQASLNLAML